MVTEKRLRTYLTRDEVTQVLRVAKSSRHGPRNFGMILLAYRHGLRASELVSLRWSDVDLQRGTIYCRRAKESRSSVHPLNRDEAAALDRILRASRTHGGDYVFHSERGKRMSRSALARPGAGRSDAGPKVRYKNAGESYTRLRCPTTGVQRVQDRDHFWYLFGFVEEVIRAEFIGSISV